MRRFLILFLAAASLAAAAIAGCGGGDGGDQLEGEAASGEADAAEVMVIEDWADKLRMGDVEKAADYFELPSTAQNGTPPIVMETHEDVVAFNEALPCGAKLTDTEAAGELIVATFELTERPGPGRCGPGVGSEARTAFQIEEGKILQWRRASDPPQVEGPIV